MRICLFLGLVSLATLAACSGGNPAENDEDHVQACSEQAEWARSGKVPTGKIAISCPDHGIGDFGH